MDWSIREGYAWAEDKEHCEEYGRMLNADPAKVSPRARKRGLPQARVLSYHVCNCLVGNAWGRQPLCGSASSRRHL